eukprot:5525198-Pleurochrysis_carterae.AAC.2
MGMRRRIACTWAWIDALHAHGCACACPQPQSQSLSRKYALAHAHTHTQHAYTQISTHAHLRILLVRKHEPTRSYARTCAHSAHARAHPCTHQGLRALPRPYTHTDAPGCAG